MLEVSDLHVSHGAVKAVKGLNFTVDKGECVGLLGGNGAGKTTTLNAICGLLKAQRGTVRFNGEDIVGLPAHSLVRKGIVQVPEGRKIFPELLVEENLKVGAHTQRQILADDLDRMYTLFPVLKERRRQKGGTLSGGEQQMLAIGRALMSHPRLLMLDEPSLGLAPVIVDRLFDALREIKSEVTVLIVEQNAYMALELVDRAYVLQQGVTIREGGGEELLQSGWLENAYLGNAETAQ
jgi:branched-chain amino acid transport system ATP-binding protein